jgi:hypothetical protein
VEGSAVGGGLAITVRFHQRGEGVLCVTQSHRWAIEMRGRRKVAVACLGLPSDSGVEALEFYLVVHVYGRGEGGRGRMMVDVVCAYALGVCVSPRLAVYPSCAAYADLPSLPRAWQPPLCVCHDSRAFLWLWSI